MRSAHNLSYLSPGKMKATLRQYVNWKGMDKDKDRYVKECSVCSIWSKSLGEHPFPTISEPAATVRFDTVQMDIFHLPGVFDADHIQYRTALSIIDMATGFPVVLPLSSSTDTAVKHHFCNSWLSLFGPPKCIIADRKSTRLNSSHLDLSRMPSSA